MSNSRDNDSMERVTSAEPQPSLSRSSSDSAASSRRGSMEMDTQVGSRAHCGAHTPHLQGGLCCLCMQLHHMSYLAQQQRPCTHLPPPHHHTHMHTLTHTAGQQLGRRAHAPQKGGALPPPPPTSTSLRH